MTCTGCGRPIPEGAERIVWTSTPLRIHTPDEVAVQEWHPGCAPQTSPEQFLTGLEKR